MSLSSRWWRLKLFIFPIWQGYVCVEYYPIVATSEKEARKTLRDLCMPKWIKRIESTCDHIRTEYGKRENRYPRTGNDWFDRGQVYNSADEEAAFYHKRMIEYREAQIAEGKDAVSVNLPLAEKGFIKDLFHVFQE